MFTSHAAIYAGLPLSLALFLSTEHDFNLSSSISVLKLFLGTQHTWPIGDWQAFVIYLSETPDYPYSYHLQSVTVEVKPFLDLIHSHLLVVDYDASQHYHLDLARLREYHSLRTNTPLSPS